MEMENLPKEAIEDWRQHEVTKAVLARLKGNLDDYRDLLCYGGTLDMQSAEQTSMRTVAIVSRADELQTILRGLGEQC